MGKPSQRYNPRNTQALKAAGIGSRSLAALASLAINNPDKLCIVDTVRDVNHNVSLRVVRALARFKDLVRAFEKNSVYNFILVNHDSESWMFVTKYADGKIHGTKIPRSIDGMYVTMETAAGMAFLEAIKPEQPRVAFAEAEVDVVYPESAEQNKEISVDPGLAEVIETIKQSNNQSRVDVPTPQPPMSSMSRMALKDMPPGLAEAILKAGIGLVNMETGEPANVDPTTLLSEIQSANADDGITDAVIKNET